MVIHAIIYLYMLEGVMMKDTMDVPLENNKNVDESIRGVLIEVIKNLDELGYNSIKQVAGYLQSGDLGYIPNYKDSRNKIATLDRDKISEELIRTYL